MCCLTSISINEALDEWYSIASKILGFNVINNVYYHPCWHWLITHRTPRGIPLGEDGHAVYNLYGNANLKRVWASSDLTFLDESIKKDDFINDVCVEASQMDISHKKGSSGNLILSPIEYVVKVNGKSYLCEKRLGIYRENAKINPSQHKTNEMSEDLLLLQSSIISFCEVDLFRYSALLKVCHRIHYDFNYATKVEGYPDVLVHGPLLGQIMMTFYKSMFPDSNALRVFFRVYYPLFANESCCINIYVASCNKRVVVQATKNNSIITMSALIDLDEELDYGKY